MMGIDYYHFTVFSCPYNVFMRLAIPFRTNSRLENLPSNFGEVRKCLLWIRQLQFFSEPKWRSFFDFGRTFNGILVISLIFAFYAFSSFIGRWSGVDPNVFLGGDSAITAAVAIAGNDLDLFKSDFLLSSAQNYRFYINFNVLFFNTIASYTGLDLGSAYYALLFPVLFFHLLGYFLLGRQVLNNGVAALSYTVACCITIPTFSGDYWGAWSEPQPRFVFAAALPFLLLLAVRSGDNLGRWCVTFLATGIATYLHPASGPPVALSMMMGMVAMVGPTISLRPLVVLMVVPGLVYLVCFLPYAVIYLGSILNAGQGVSGGDALRAAAFRFNSGYLDLPTGIRTALSNTWYSARAVMLVLAVAGWWIVYRYARDERGVLRLWTGYGATMMFAACIIPLVEHAIAAARGTYVLEFDIVRSVRYLVPVVILFAFWGACRLPLRRRQLMGAALAIVLSLVWIAAKESGQRFTHNGFAIRAWSCWIRGIFFCEVPDFRKQQIALLEHVRRHVPPGSKFVSPNFGLALRYHARMSVVIDLKDFGFLAYSNHRKLVEAVPLGQRYRQALSHSDVSDRTRAIVAFARDVGAEYVLLSWRAAPELAAELGKIVVQNDEGLVLQL